MAREWVSTPVVWLVATPEQEAAYLAQWMARALGKERADAERRMQLEREKEERRQRWARREEERQE